VSSATLRISVDELRQIADLLLDYVTSRHGESMDLERSHFWSVPVMESFDLADQPDLTVGSIAESWGHLTDMRTDGSKVVGYGLVWLADALRAIASETP
jgi:hypothetical protein